MINEIKSELMEVLNIFQEAYIQRDSNKYSNSSWMHYLIKMKM